jgi:uncharacterized protein (DUF697 family)
MTDSPHARRARRPAKPGRGPPPALPSRAQDIQHIVERCRRLVTRRALLSAGASVVPLPGFDLMVDLGVLIRILHEVNAEFGLTPQQIEALTPARQYTVYKAINTLGASAVGRLITREVVALFARSVARRLATKSVLRFVPLAGTALAASISFVALKTLGDRHVADCARVAASAARAG